ncbi:hypothetical protein [Xylella fastidiosa]|uniref:hypothetical protein n=1 Tax=Xylella fastidiosa TaxID=2371 RepID=UPI001E4287DB|nr:hypothetical protein [Xylella fastidiosa]
MSDSEMKIQANALMPELVAELVALKQEAERFLFHAENPHEGDLRRVRRCRAADA